MYAGSETIKTHVLEDRLEVKQNPIGWNIIPDQRSEPYRGNEGYERNRTALRFIPTTPNDGYRYSCYPSAGIRANAVAAGKA